MRGASGAKLIKKRKSWKSRNAVSEIIGNILILAITVIMFSSIFIFVASMDGPSEKVYTDFTGSVVTKANGDVEAVKIINKGGQPLEDSRTVIYLFVSDVATSLRITDSTPSIGTTWNTGATWNYTGLTGVTRDAKISVMIVDVQANTVVWEATLQGSDVASTAPIIGGRGISATSSPIAGTVQVGDSIKFFAYVSSPYGAIDPGSVTVNASRLTGFGSDPIALKNDGSGVYWSVASYPASQAWNGKVITFHAVDVNGQKVSANFVVKVVTGSSGPENPLDDYTDDLVNGDYPSDASAGQSGGGNSRLGTTFYYIRDAETREITRDFQPGDKVLIELYSNAMMNLALENSFEITHPLNGEPMPQSKFSGAFVYGGLYSGFYRYTLTFTAPTDKLVYPLQIEMKDYHGTNLNVRDSISISGAAYPIIETYKWDEKNNTLVKTGNFAHTDRIYLKIITRDTDTNIAGVQVGTITISDFSGRYLVKSAPTTPTASPAIPAYQAPMSSLFKTSSTSDSAGRLDDSDQTGEYTIYIELKAADLSWWLPKRNSYTLTMSYLTDLGNPGQGETYYNIAAQFNVTAPLSLTDIVASIGTGSYTWSSSGAQWDNSKLAWFEKGVGSNAWGKTSIADPTFDGPLAMTIADMDNDGIKDLLVAFQDASVSIAWYKCEDVNGKTWSEMPNIIVRPFDAHPGEQASDNTYSGSNGRITGSNNDGLANEDVTLYIPGGTRLSQGWFQSYNFPGGFVTKSTEVSMAFVEQNELCVAMETGDFNGDGYTDIVASYAHVVIYSTAINENDAKEHPEKTQAMFFNRGVYVFWGDDGGWRKTALGSTMDWRTESPKANSNDNPAVLDLAVGDFNKDGCDDIVGVYETGKTSIWVSAWKESLTSSDRHLSTFASPPIVPAVTDTVGGYKPFDHTQRMPRVEVAQMDNQGYLDIVRTSTRNDAIYIIHTTGKDASIVNTYPNAEYGTNGTRPTASMIHTEEGLDVNGWIKDLISVDGKIETITEIYLESDILVSLVGSKGVWDSTGEILDNVKKPDDGTVYNVNAGKLLHIQKFSTGSGNLGKTIATAVLHVQYSVDSTYNGYGHVLWSKNGNNQTTGVIPASSDSTRHLTYDLFANGIVAEADLDKLSISFEHNGTAGAVRFDAIWLEITFVEGRYLEWQFEIPNKPGLSIHNLDITASCSSEDESYSLMYSPDNTTWFPLGTISGTGETDYSYPLYYTSNSKYYLKLVDVNRAIVQSNNRSVQLEMVRISHYSPGVEWLAGNLKYTGVTGLGAGDYITAIAIGDMGSNGAVTAVGASHAIDGLNDVVAATSWVGGTTTHTLFVLTGQAAGGLDTPMSIDTSALAAAVGSSAKYDASAIALGDFDADYDLDIVLIVGFAPGQGGGAAIPTIWTYSNEPQTGSWTFGEAPLSVLGAGEAGINVEVGNINLSLFFPFIGLTGIVVASITIERLARSKR